MWLSQVHDSLDASLCLDVMLDLIFLGDHTVALLREERVFCGQQSMTEVSPDRSMDTSCILTTLTVEHREETAMRCVHLATMNVKLRVEHTFHSDAATKVIGN